MRFRQRLILTLGFAIIWFASSGDRATAHPHAWIDLESAAVLDEDGRLVAIDQYWLFGDFYSAYLINDIQSSNVDMVDGLRETARSNLVELRAYDYFTRVTADAENVAFEAVDKFETGVIKGRVYLKFTLTLSAPLDPKRQTVRYAVYDPTYYVEVLHAEGIDPVVRGPADACTLALAKPEPTFEELAFAASLDQTESGGDGLGAAFAEWVTLTCP